VHASTITRGHRQNWRKNDIVVATASGLVLQVLKLDVLLIAYVPLRSGMLTGKFHADRELSAKLPRTRRMMLGISDKNIDRTAPLIDGLREIADSHSATISQVALAWLITYYGDTVVAIPAPRSRTRRKKPLER
jgi:aryl-alcohol dehydrogenase-like predicted oxidoreductase